MTKKTGMVESIVNSNNIGIIIHKKIYIHLQMKMLHDVCPLQNSIVSGQVRLIFCLVIYEKEYQEDPNVVPSVLVSLISVKLSENSFQYVYFLAQTSYAVNKNLIIFALQ